MKQIHKEAQGSDAWLALRLTKRPASLIAAVMGLSSLTTRNEVLRAYATGIPAEINDYVEKFVFAEGHRVEPLARAIIEAQIGEDLSPVVYSDGLLSASTDGITFSEDIGFECKQWNDDLAKSVIDGIVPDSHMPQVQQCLLVTGADEWYFTVSDGTADKTVFTVVKPSQEWFDRIKAGWEQFEIDLANYAPVIHAKKPLAEATKDLPALFVHAYGEITTNNMEDYGDALALKLESIRSIVLVNDQDFVNAKKAGSLCRDQIVFIRAEQKKMLEGTTSIGQASRIMDDWCEDLRVTALQLEKNVKREDLAKKEAIVLGAKLTYTDYISALSAKVEPVRLTYAQVNFAEAIAKKRDYNSMQNGVDTMLANAKIAANQLNEIALEKLAYFKVTAANYKFLFNDLQQMIVFEKDHFEMTVRVRIDSHKKAEADKLEAQRLQIEAEATRKAEAEQAAKLEAERAIVRAEEQAKITEQQRLDKLELEATRAKQAAEQVVIDAEQKAKAEAEALRKTAAHIEQAAQYADRNADKAAELAGAAKLRKQADDIELPFKDDSIEIEPTLIRPILSKNWPSQEYIVSLLAGDLNVSNNNALHMILNAFGIEIEELAA